MRKTIWIVVACILTALTAPPAAAENEVPCPVDQETCDEVEQTVQETAEMGIKKAEDTVGLVLGNSPNWANHHWPCEEGEFTYVSVESSDNQASVEIEGDCGGSSAACAGQWACSETALVAAKQAATGGCLGKVSRGTAYVDCGSV